MATGGAAGLDGRAALVERVEEPVALRVGADAVGQERMGPDEGRRGGLGLLHEGVHRAAHRLLIGHGQLRQRDPPHDDALILVLDEELAGLGARGHLHHGQQLRQVLDGPGLLAHPRLEPLGLEVRVQGQGRGPGGGAPVDLGGGPVGGAPQLRGTGGQDVPRVPGQGREGVGVAVPSAGGAAGQRPAPEDDVRPVLRPAAEGLRVLLGRDPREAVRPVVHPGADDLLLHVAGARRGGAELESRGTVERLIGAAVGVSQDIEHVIPPWAGSRVAP